jgi:hypothetical protein
MKQVWYVAGDPDMSPSGLWPNLFETKECAEIYARHAFPDESESERYARVFCRDVLTIKEIT